MKRTFSRALLFFSLLISFTAFSPASYQNDLIKDVLDNTNQFRKSRGLPALVNREDLNRIAEKHSADMAAGRQPFGHNGFDRREQQMKEKISGASTFAENVAYGAKSGKEVVNGWRKSKGHRQNMLGPFKYIGIGIARDKRGAIYYTQIFVD